MVAQTPEYQRTWRQRNPKRAKYTELAREKSRLRRRRHPDKVRQEYRRHRLKQCGFTETTYAQILATQGGHCYFCEKTQENDGRRLHADHNHKTGKARGILCFSHNQALGKFGDNEEGLLRALQYVRSTR
jgi:Recombination endonuclease VII